VAFPRPGGDELYIGQPICEKSSTEIWADSTASSLPKLVRKEATAKGKPPNGGPSHGTSSTPRWDRIFLHHDNWVGRPARLVRAASWYEALTAGKSFPTVPDTSLAFRTALTRAIVWPGAREKIRYSGSPSQVAPVIHL
jgi:hypothetical protein